MTQQLPPDEGDYMSHESEQGDDPIDSAEETSSSVDSFADDPEYPEEGNTVVVA